MQSIVQQYYERVINSGDPRTENLPFVRDPFWIISITAFYILAINYGQKVMANRSAFELRSLLVFYNLCSVAGSLWMMYEIAMCTFFNLEFDVVCQDLEPSHMSPNDLRLINALWVYFMSKIPECCDTIFFVLRKRNRQISFLHVYHHASMLLLQWLTIKYQPGSISWFGPLCNSFIHAVMYTYYGLAAIGPHMQKYLWWKRYLTMMQLIQFVVVLGQLGTVVYMGCKFNKVVMSANVFFISSLLYLFGKFYVASYTQSAVVQKKEK